jgi:two-component system chemotaxis response regulator CheB
MKHINSGEIGFSTSGEVFITLLGSCVSICIYDPILKIGGINHFLLPDRECLGSGSQANCSENPLNFAEESIIELLRLFKKSGSNPSTLIVYLLGGGTPIEGSQYHVGVLNVKKGKDILAKFNFKITKEKTQSHSMSVKFDTGTGEVFLKTNDDNRDVQSSRTVPVSKISSGPIKVLIVDDSNPIRRVLRACLERNNKITIVGEACDPFEAEELRKKFNPDVLTLDVNMPNKDGVTYLSELMLNSPLPVIMVTELNLKEASPIMKALEIGAFDYIQKPAANEIDQFGKKLSDMIIAADKFKSKISKKKNGKTTPSIPHIMTYDPSIELIAIGSSTGGTEALREIFKDLPSLTPPIVIVQHIPPSFSKAFADSLNKMSKIEVREAVNGDCISKNTAYIAPGGKQMKIIFKNGQLKVEITDDPPVNRFKPSVDYMFNSIAELPVAKKSKVALLTGMGDDGAKGMLKLRNLGALTIAQSEESCVVYGMPKVAVEIKAAQKILDLSEISYHLLKKAS